MLQVIQFPFFALDLFFQKTDLLFRLEIVIRDVKLEQNALGIRGLSPKTIDLAVFRHLIINIRRYFLQIFFTFITA